MLTIVNVGLAGEVLLKWLPMVVTTLGYQLDEVEEGGSILGAVPMLPIGSEGAGANICTVLRTGHPELLNISGTNLRGRLLDRLTDL